MSSLDNPRSVSVSERDWQRTAINLVAATMAYNVIKAVIGIGAGLTAESVALLGFGFDSVIETVGAGLLLWRLSIETPGADRHRVEQTERRVHQFVGVTFLALAVYVVAQATFALWSERPPAESRVGILLAVASLVIMPIVAWAKLCAADEIGSPALRAEAKETLACSYLSFTLLLGLTANATLGWWWARSQPSSWCRGSSRRGAKAFVPKGAVTTERSDGSTVSLLEIKDAKRSAQCLAEDLERESRRIQSETPSLIRVSPRPVYQSGRVSSFLST